MAKDEGIIEDAGELPVAELVYDRKSKVRYYNLPCAFDIETTNINDDPKNRMAFPYHMQLMIGTYFIRCRTIDELGQVFSKLQQHYGLDGTHRLIMYVHNLPFEFQFIRCYFHFCDCMSKSQRQVYKVFFDQFGIEMRDSYALSGMSLAKTAENLTWPEHSSIRKLKGDLDYRPVRFPSTKLTDAEIGYCFYDVKIICCYIEEQIKMYHGDITRIPLTNTGRVRRFVRNHCFHWEKSKKTGKKYCPYKGMIRRLTLEPLEYGYLKQAFLGGYTHANAMYSTKMLKDVHSIDFTSSYPTVMMSEQYPMSKGAFIDNLNITSYDDFVKFLNDRLAVVEVELWDIETKPEVPDDYLSDSRVREKQDVIQNNGRIHKAAYVKEILTNIDLEMVVKAYSFTSIKITSGWFYYKNYLPREIIECILEFYEKKTTLKGVKGKEAEYLLKKGMLNSLYGMCVTDICKDEENCTFEKGWWTVSSEGNEAVLIDKYNKDPNRFLSYAWGVFITAYARRNLFTGIMSMGKDYVYCDTDSIKFLNMDAHKAYIEDYNRNIIRKCTECLNSHGLDPAMLAPKNQKGVEKQIGIWDYEGRYDYFKTLGCKRYLTYKDGEYDLTCAGLPTKAGLDALLADGTDIQQVFGKFNQTFDVPVGDADKLGHCYRDTSFEYSGVDKNGKYDRITYRSCCVLFDISFTVTFAELYQLYLDNYVGVVDAL